MRRAEAAHDTDAAVPPELLATALEMTWTVGEHSRYELEAAREHFAVLRAAQLVNRAFHAASIGPFRALLVESETAMRWLAAMEARGVNEERGAMLRVFVMDTEQGDDVEILRLAASNLEVVVYTMLESAWPASLPLVHFLSLTYSTLSDLAAQHLPSLRTLHIDGVYTGSAPEWPSTGMPALRTLSLAFPDQIPSHELVNIERLVNLQSLSISSIYSGDLDLLFGNMSATAQSIEQLSLDFVQISLEGEEDDPQRTLDELRSGCAHAAARLPSLSALSLRYGHGGAEVSSADYVLSRMGQLIEDASTWPRLRRVEVGLASADDEHTLFELPEICERRGIKLVPMLKYASRPRYVR